jgi:hypothetical protein
MRAPWGAKLVFQRMTSLPLRAGSAQTALVGGRIAVLARINANRVPPSKPLIYWELIKHPGQIRHHFRAPTTTPVQKAKCK